MNERIIKIPDGYSFKDYEAFDFESVLAIYDWRVEHEKVIIDMSRCFHANYLALALLILYIWHLKSRNCHIEFLFSHNKEGASKMWHLMGAVGWHSVLTKEHQNFQGHDCKPLIAIRNQDDFSNALLKAESYTKSVHIEYEKTVRYVVSELLYNTLEHGTTYRKIANEERRIPAIIQFKCSKKKLDFIVADLGIGIKKHLEKTYSPFEDHQSAIKYALKPKISGTFGVNDPYKKKDNAGVGLYITSNILQRLNANLHIISGDGQVIMSPRQIKGYTLNNRWPGTFVWVELPLGNDLSLSLHSLMSEFRDAAARELGKKPEHSQDKFYLSIENDFGRFAEDKGAAINYRDRHLIPALEDKKSLILDFDNVISAPHSFLSALLATPIKRLGLPAYKKIKIVNAAPEIRETIDFILDENT
jgi:hypothetical protein